MNNLYAIVFAFLFSINVMLGSSTPVLSPPLAAVISNEFISEDSLIEEDVRNAYLHSPISWIDNERIIYSNGGQINIFNADSKTQTTLCKGFHPVVSPCGQWVAFVGTNIEGNQIWLMKIDGTQKRQLTHVDGGFSDFYGYDYNFSWSLDSARLAFFVNAKQPLDLRLSIASVPSTIEIIDIDTGLIQEVYSGLGLISDLSWYPDGQHLLMSNLIVGFLYDVDHHTTTVQSVSLNNGEVSILTRFNGLQQCLHPQLSPTGEQISFLYCAESELFNYMLSLGVIDSRTPDQGACITQLTHDLQLSSALWSRDGKALYVKRQYGAYNQIYVVDAKSGFIKQITNEPLFIRSHALSPNGARLAWEGKDVRDSFIMRMASVDGSNLQDLIIESPKTTNKALSEVREVEWETVDYPAKMRGLLLLPNHYKAGARYPLIIDVHGGGSGSHIHLSGGILTTSPLEWQLWTRRGYAVFVPEFRSSASFGFLATRRDELQAHDIVNCDMLDVIAGVDELIRQGIVDNDRMAVIGNSAGGRRVNWLTVSSNRFKAIISKEGWADEWELALNRPVLWEQFGGSPLQVPENYLKNSALHHAKSGITPTLFLMGNPQLGGVDPYRTVYQLHMALKKNGVDTEYVEYLDEGHSLELIKNRKDALRRTFEWIDRHFSRGARAG